MSESDSFIQEVSEEVRRDRMYAVWRRYGPWLIAAIVALVLAVAAMGWWEQREETRRAELGGALLEADTLEDPEEAAAAFLAVAEDGSYSYPVLARLRAAASLAEAGKIEEAAAQYEAIRAMEGIEPRFRDLADLRLVMLMSERMDPDEMLDRLGPLTVNESAWRLPALEYEAAAHLRKGQPRQALASLRTILDIPQLTPAAQGRTAELIEAVEAMLPSEEAAPSDTEEEITAPSGVVDDAASGETEGDDR